MKAAPARSWQERSQWIADLLQRRTGADVSAWNAKIRKQTFMDEAAHAQQPGECAHPGHVRRSG
jgi:hypothetical protein